MSIEYSYEVIAVDEAARVMEVVYTSPGRQTMRIGARLPYEGESLEAIIRMYAPVPIWTSQEAVVVPPAVGATGQIAPPAPDMSLPAVKARKLTELALARFSYEVGGVTVGGARIKTDRESQATISGAYTTLKDGLVPSIDWKADGGQWVQLTVTEMAGIAQAVAQHVQSSFTLERQLAAQVAAATTVEQVQAVTWPQ